MPKRQLAAFLSCSALELTDEEKRLFAKIRPAGITLFARNIADIEQIKNLISQIKNTAGPDTLIAIDQEGGRVRRLKEPDFMPYGSAFQIGSLPLPQARKIAKLHAKLISHDLNSVGIDVNFAPVLDVLHDNTTSALGSRCFSSDSKLVAQLGKIMLKSYIDNGIIPCIKHLPGHGFAVSDPHLGLPVINKSLSELKTEFAPFKACNFSPFGMTAHILLPQIDSVYPITQSAIGISKIIRGVIGFDGFLISDAIDMKALQGTPSEKALASLQAGCDCVCYCMGYMDEMLDLAKNCPQLSDEACERLDKAKQILHNKKVGSDIIRESDEYLRVMNNVAAYSDKYDATEVLHQLQRKS